MRDHLDQRHEGDAEPGNLPVRAVAVLTLGAVLAAGAALGSGASAQKPSAGEIERRIVLVSGRDDHGVLVEPRIGVSRFVGGARRAHVSDGTLVAVEAVHGEWLQVRALEGTGARGWVNDYYLRGTAHLVRRVPPFPLNAQVELLAVEGAKVQVRALESGRVGWVPRAALAELPRR